MPSEALAGPTPRYRRLMETMLYLEILLRPYTEVAGDSGPGPGSIGFTRQKCLQHLRWRLAELGFR
jgi:hypothetical protein